MAVYLILGITYGFAAAVQPGPLSTYLISQTLRFGWRRALPGVLAPLISDGPIALLALVVLSNVPAGLVVWLRVVGGVFVLYLAVGAWKAWREYDERGPRADESSRQSVMKAVTVNVLNPNPYLGWSTVLGPLLLKGWHEAPARGVALVAGFYTAIIATMAGLVVVFQVARGSGPRVNRVMIAVSAAALACFGLWQLWLAAMALWPR
jgi:threonine/homoserine/homoserine lactone efflux protein